MIVWQILFWGSLFLILHSYVLFPLLLIFRARNKKINTTYYKEEELPRVAIVMALYNEEAILQEKLRSILASEYPHDKIRIYAGSDASKDKTNIILKDFEKKHPLIRPVIFEKRQGKPSVINKIMEIVEEDIIVMTDAKVIFNASTITNLVRHFANPKIGAVGGNLQNGATKKDGGSIPEKTFMQREILMKYREGIIWGASTGLYGALYAIRKENYMPVPDGFSVDDFFITMNVIRQKKESILDLESIANENVPALFWEEYKRKVRIATGNFRNARYFSKELFQPWKGANFSYISHKFIRWNGPLLIILFSLASLFLSGFNPIYTSALFSLVLVCFMSLFDFLLSKIGIHIVFLRFIRHFIYMNVALLHGFINYIRGIKSDVWEPTRRN